MVGKISVGTNQTVLLFHQEGSCSCSWRKKASSWRTLLGKDAKFLTHCLHMRCSFVQLKRE